MNNHEQVRAGLKAIGITITDELWKEIGSEPDVRGTLSSKGIFVTDDNWQKVLCAAQANRKETLTALMACTYDVCYVMNGCYVHRDSGTTITPSNWKSYRKVNEYIYSCGLSRCLLIRALILRGSDDLTISLGEVAKLVDEHSKLYDEGDANLKKVLTLYKEWKSLNPIA